MVRDENGRWIPSKSHTAIIPEALFNRVQVELSRRYRSRHYVTALVYPLRGLAHCGSCGRVYTPYEQKGILYFYARCPETCPNRAVSEYMFEPHSAGIRPQPLEGRSP